MPIICNKRRWKPAERMQRRMIRGVNRRIVEITGMDNDYFEKAVLYIRTDKSASLPSRIDLEARAAVGQIIQEESRACRKRSHIIADVTLRLLSVSLILCSAALTLYLFLG